MLYKVDKLTFCGFVFCISAVYLLHAVSVSHTQHKSLNTGPDLQLLAITEPTNCPLAGLIKLEENCPQLRFSDRGVKARTA